MILNRKTDKDKIDFFEQQGFTKLPDKHRQQILTIFQRYQDKWYTPEVFAEGLDMSQSYAYKICEALTMARIVERQKYGKQNYYRMKNDTNEKGV